MKQGEEYIIQPRDSHLKNQVMKITLLENTSTTVYYQIEDRGKERMLHSDFEKYYRIIEKICKLDIE